MSADGQLKVVLVGHVDHGKSTVIGRLLADSGALPTAKIEEIREACRRSARPYEYAFLLDALKDEQGQGITIELARCFLRTARRHYQLIDAPGHVEFLKKMISGAALAEAAFLVIDAEEGIRENSRRHGYLLSLLGLKQLSVLINKMDRVGYQEATFARLEEEYRGYLRGLHVEPLSFVPICAREGENLVARSPRMPWYRGPTVLEQLDAFEEERGEAGVDLRFPVQDVYKFTEQGDTRRILAGTVRTGTVAVGEELEFFPSRRRAVVRSIEGFHCPPRSSAQAGEAVGLTLDRELFVPPGELAASTRGATRPRIGARLRANVFWMGKRPLVKDRPYKLKLHTSRATAHLVEVLQVIDSADLSTHRDRSQVAEWDLAECVLETARPVAFDAAAGPLGTTGRFVLVDDHEIAGWGIVLEGLDAEPAAPAGEGGGAAPAPAASRDLREHEFQVTPADRAALNGHGACVLWLTGLSGAGKSTLASALAVALHRRRVHTQILDGDHLRLGLNADLGFSREDRRENIRRAGEVCRLAVEAGLVAIAAFISPYRADRDAVRARLPAGQFVEVHLDCPVEVCRARDPKGFYARAVARGLPDVPGINSPYEAPEAAELTLRTAGAAVEETVEEVLAYLERRGLIPAAHP